MTYSMAEQFNLLPVDGEEKELPEIRLRGYQTDVVSQVESALAGKKNRRLLVVAPTGSGKTIIAVEIIRREVERGGMVLFIAHRRELIHQCSDKLKRFGVDHGLIMAGESKSLFPDVQVASIQTLSRRLSRGIIKLPPATMLIIDEAHHANAKSYLRIVDHYREASIIGLTATPCRGDGRGLGVAA